MGRQRDRAQVARDRRRIADLYLQGKLQADIAQIVGVDQSTVSRDLVALHGEWLKSALMDFSEAKSRELARVDLLEREYYDAWQRSKKGTETETKKLKGAIRREPDGQGEFVTERPAEVTSVEKGQVGDPRFLQGVQWCIERRCKIFGFDAPVKIAPTDPSGKQEYAGLTDRERAARIMAALQLAQESEGSGGVR